MLLVRISKRADGSGVLRCVRGDGSATWQKQESRHAAFFALHDLTHFAVESALGFRRAFYGLIAEGWDVEDTTGKGARGPLPDEALFAEFIVGWLDRERASGTTWNANEFNQSVALYTTAAGKPAPPPLTDDQLAAARARRHELFSRWSAVPAGEALELRFGI